MIGEEIEPDTARAATPEETAEDARYGLTTS